MKKPERPPIKEKINLAKLIGSDPEILREISALDLSYPYWETFKHKVFENSTLKKYKNSDLWQVLKFFRNPQSFRFSSNRSQKFRYSITNKISQQLHQFDMNLGGSIQSDAVIPDHNKERYLISSLMEEAIASSQLEGAVTTRSLAKEMLRSNRKPKTHSEKMILNNYSTIKEVVAKKDQKLSLDFIKHIHSIVSKDTLREKEFEGNFRKNNEVKVVDGITGEVFYDPPNFEEVESMMKDVCEFINKGEDDLFIHPIVKAIILHFLIGYIHPFMDGNGRTARALFYWFLLRKGYWIVEYLSISRIILKSSAQYSRAYLHTEYDENDLTYFIDYNLKCMSQALEEFKKYVRRKVTEKKKIFEFMRSENISERQAQIMAEFHKNPDTLLSIKEVENVFGIVYQTARTDLLDLVEKKYLKSKTSGKKMIFFKD